MKSEDEQLDKRSNLSYLTTTLADFRTYFTNKFPKEQMQQANYIFFLSIGNPSIRAKVIKGTAHSIEKAISQLERKAIQLIQKGYVDPQWIKIDMVNEIFELPFSELEKKIAKTRKNYFRYGISFDKEFRLAFLEQEINGNAMIKSEKNGPLKLNEKNMNHYIKNHLHSFKPFSRSHYAGKVIYPFTTVSVFQNRKSPVMYELYDGEQTNGIRKVKNIEEETKNLITKSTYFLVKQLQDNGQFVYGYFSAFAKEINTYNILRHSSTLYSMAEGYDIIRDTHIIKAVEKGIDYLIREAIVYKKNARTPIAFVVDHANESEIKLGSNATAILAMTKYMEITGATKYLAVAQALARGILEMKTPSGGFIHVLTYPTFDIKALHRIIYYEGEAVFSLLRLYAMDHQDIWLNEVKDSFDHFIEKEYWQHHDHWLSYAANELTLYEPDDQYFIFGLKNCHERLQFMYHRETTYPTFLELTMAAYKMVQSIKQHKKEYLLTNIDEEFLVKTIDKRAEYQRVGFFYPELAMYKKLPGLILDSFFIRHHSFRVRIDDIEHYLSGYCQFYQHRIPAMKQDAASLEPFIP